MTHNLKDELPEIGKYVMLYYKDKYSGIVDWTYAKLNVKNDIELVWKSRTGREIQFIGSNLIPYEWIGD